jgi:AcrR family transcriptional regulator
VAAPARTRRSPVDKFEERRRELATAALQTLGERGYAKTSLREIALNSAYSHGVVHYYFANKIELISYCVRQYKIECVTRYDAIIASAASADELAVDFADALVTTVSEDAPMHRLWYDLRSQALFEPALAPQVLDIDTALEQMIWRVVSRYAELRATTPALPPSRAYALFDGLFEQALVRGDARELHAGTLQLLPFIA